MQFLFDFVRKLRLLDGVVLNLVGIKTSGKCVYPLKPHLYTEKLGFACVYLFISSPEPLGSQGELIGWP